MAKILIVDDSYIMRMKIKTMLTNAGHSVVGEAVNGEQAILEYSQKQPDIVTMDISMPVMDGISALRMILSKYPSAKIIVISALDKRNMVLAALESGAKNYILKPIDEIKLYKVIECVLKDESRIRKPGFSGSCAPQPADQPIPFDLEAEINTPFSIDNKSGTFVINIGKTLHSENFSALGNAVQGFLYVKPLSVIFNFGSTEETDDDVLQNIRKLSSAIKMVGGSVKLASTSGVMQERLRNAMPNIQINACIG